LDFNRGGGGGAEKGGRGARFGPNAAPPGFKALFEMKRGREGLPSGQKHRREQGGESDSVCGLNRDLFLTRRRGLRPTSTGCLTDGLWSTRQKKPHQKKGKSFGVGHPLRKTKSIRASVPISRTRWSQKRKGKKKENAQRTGDRGGPRGGFARWDASPTGGGGGGRLSTKILEGGNKGKAGEPPLRALLAN